MNNYENKGIKSWTVKDTEEYFKNILNDDQQDKLRVITSEELDDQEDLDLQAIVATWYFKQDLKRTDEFLEELLKKVKKHTVCNDFLVHIYVPIGNEDMCFGIKFEAIAKEKNIQIGFGSFQGCMLKGLNSYLTNDSQAKSMIVIKGFDTSKEIFYEDEGEKLQTYYKDVFHFVVEDELLFGVSKENAAKVQENDLTTKKYIGKEVGITYIDTHIIVAEFEVDKLMQEVGIYLLNS